MLHYTKHLSFDFLILWIRHVDDQKNILEQEKHDKKKSRKKTTTFLRVISIELFAARCVCILWSFVFFLTMCVCVCVYDSAGLRVYWRSQLELEQQETNKKRIYIENVFQGFWSVFISSYLSWDWKHVGSFSLIFFYNSKKHAHVSADFDLNYFPFNFKFPFLFCLFYFFVWMIFVCVFFFPLFHFTSLLMWVHFFLSPHITHPTPIHFARITNRKASLAFTASTGTVADV